ncbi:hypothetical protein AV274_1636 [Blastocystis sp. ATCC 50177/Nand II]|uniref:CCR4-NOT transcription complex subunit 3 n=1 Tax=Blastocystis sp. subtype 1 (strain ATCC 50177 / NandII) TaxID=478820 RepID=A0A196SL54_BLAHN|nr:hypothetical protein AV274_1636 [Blastocystis sp. ATCC 50177/Nand II]
MSSSRKIRTEIDNTFKKIKEGFEEFDALWNCVYSADTQAKKERYEADLKRQLNKLQKLRDSLKTWEKSSDSAITQYRTQIADYRSQIEDKMKEFKKCEKETKTKAYSKEGLRQPSKQSPKDEKRDEVCTTVKRLLAELHKQIEDCEVEERRERAKKKNVNQSLVSTLEEHIENHQWYIERLEVVLRQLDNEILDPYGLDDCLSAAEDYLASYRDKDYFFDSSVFDELGLDDSRVTTPVEPDSPNDALRSPAVKVIPPIPAVLAAPKPKPVPITPAPINYAQVLQRATSKSAPSPPKPAAPPAVTLTAPSFVPPTLSPADLPVWGHDELIALVEDAYRAFTAAPPAPLPALYTPAVPLSVPESFPQTPSEELHSAAVLDAMDANTLLFAFAYAENEEEKVRVKRALEEKGWIWSVEAKSWTNPKVGTFDYSTWKMKSVS